jgi:hypothetical protein
VLIATSHPSPDIQPDEPRWQAEIALWQLLADEEMANRRRRPLNLDLLECLLAPEVYAAEVDVEDTYGGRGMQPAPTYPPAPTPRADNWRDEPVLAPWLGHYPTLRQLLDSGGVNAVYRWARVEAAEADAYGLHTVGLTDQAIGELLSPPRNSRTVAALIEKAEDRILHALRHLDQMREATAV